MKIIIVFLKPHEHLQIILIAQSKDIDFQRTALNI